MSNPAINFLFHFTILPPKLNSILADQFLNVIFQNEKKKEIKCWKHAIIYFNSYTDYIPLSIGERVVYQSTPNGNCIYNAISLILYGNETMATTLKLSSVVHMVDDIIPFSKYVSLCFSDHFVYLFEEMIDWS